MCVVKTVDARKQTRAITTHVMKLKRKISGYAFAVRSKALVVVVVIEIFFEMKRAGFPSAIHSFTACDYSYLNRSSCRRLHATYFTHKCPCAFNQRMVVASFFAVFYLWLAKSSPMPALVTASEQWNECLVATSSFRECSQVSNASVSLQPFRMSVPYVPPWLVTQSQI